VAVWLYFGADYSLWFTPKKPVLLIENFSLSLPWGASLKRTLSWTGIDRYSPAVWISLATTPAARYSLLSSTRSCLNAFLIQSLTSAVSIRDWSHLNLTRAFTKYSDGFQLLHAVYIVEKFLQDLLSRRCRFQIICFDQNEDLCVPPNADHTDWPKYALARSIISRHLARNLNLDNRLVFKRFISFTSVDFKQHLNESGAYFIMCHDQIPQQACQASIKPLT
jgi:hypothetical protein